jgi:hypothetical protein
MNSLVFSTLCSTFSIQGRYHPQLLFIILFALLLMDLIIFASQLMVRIGQGVCMDHNIIIPDEYKATFQRLVPYFTAALRDDPQGLESILLYLKVGGEKLAHIAIEAYKQNQRLSYAEAQKRLREAALAADLASRSEEDDDDADEDEDEDDPNNDDEGDY